MTGPELAKEVAIFELAGAIKLGMADLGVELNAEMVESIARIVSLDLEKRGVDLGMHTSKISGG